MNLFLLAILFLVSFGMALVGVYMKGYENGKKKMLGDLIDKKIISTDIYVQFLKILNK
jgi:hypothetical protein